jgi:hemin uptake protein HemP
MTEPQARPPAPAEEQSPPPIPRVVAAREILGDRREVWIEHDGVRYRLRITRRNKLILQK